MRVSRRYRNALTRQLQSLVRDATTEYETNPRFRKAWAAKYLDEPDRPEPSLDEFRGELSTGIEWTFNALGFLNYKSIRNALTPGFEFISGVRADLEQTNEHIDFGIGIEWRTFSILISDSSLRELYLQQLLTILATCTIAADDSAERNFLEEGLSDFLHFLVHSVEIPPKLLSEMGSEVCAEVASVDSGVRNAGSRFQQIARIFEMNTRIGGTPFSVGTRVFHIKFGNGTVTAIDGNKLIIAFEKIGEKRVRDIFVETV